MNQLNLVTWLKVLYDEIVVGQIQIYSKVLKVSQFYAAFAVFGYGLTVSQLSKRKTKD